MEEISNGKADLTFRIPEQGNNELSKLASNCNAVISSLNRLVQDLQGETGVLNETGDVEAGVEREETTVVGIIFVIGVARE